jgi:6-pyruvoyltetrahydropterin/6-carboxytetrahydropterin synthase
MSLKKSVSKIFTFDSAHSLRDYNGPCKNIHGHTYKLEVKIEGEIDNRGLIMDFHDLNRIVKEEIIVKLDHFYLNDIFEFNPTCENIAVWIYEKLEKLITKHKCNLTLVKLWETPTSFATIENN